MRKLLIFTGLALVLVFPAVAQNEGKPADGAVQNTIEPAKEADIRRLLEITGAKNLAKQMMGDMGNNIKPLVMNSLPPGTYREKLVDLFFEKFQSKANGGVLVDMAVPLYDKYLTHEEVKGLLQFYSTPLGQKAISVLPKLSGEMQQQGRAWGEKLGRDSMMEVLDEHPDLRAQLEQAAKEAHGK
jgi:uncharacterized protein